MKSPASTPPFLLVVEDSEPSLKQFSGYATGYGRHGPTALKDIAQRRYESSESGSHGPESKCPIHC